MNSNTHNNIHNKLKTALEQNKEKDVENIYRAELLKLVPEAKITSPYAVDGLFENGNLRMLLEFKFDEQMKLKLPQCNVLIQVLYYLKKFELSGEKLPNVIFVGDVNECFAIHSNAIINYLSSEINWSLAPSEAHRQNPVLLQAMIDDINILPFVFDVDEKFSLQDVLIQLKDLSDNVIRKIRVTEHNITSIFEYFDKNVLGEKSKLSTNEKANLFIQLLIDTGENYLHPKKKNILVSRGFGEISINSNLHSSFFKHFEGEVYSPKEKEKLTGFVDRLVEDTVRRRKGEFFTPTIWVDEAHKYISNAFGLDWKEKYVVWDCACGTLNLTRDYKFKELYCSTLEQSDIDTANHMGYNPESVKFQYDFLNDGIGPDGNIDVLNDSKLPEGLKKAILDGKQILFFINPPYIKATPNKGHDGTGISNTKIGEIMVKHKYGIASSQLSTQFLYKITNIAQKNTNTQIGIFNKPNYLTSDGFKIVREYFLSHFGFNHGFLFNASNFSDTADSWGITFNMFKNVTNAMKTSFIHDVLELDDTFSIKMRCKKTLYNCDGDIIKANIIFNNMPKNNFEFPVVKSYITVDIEELNKLGVNGAIGYINNHSNNMMQQRVVFLASSVISANGNKAIMQSNFSQTNALFVARKAVQQNWINDKDEYMAPNESHSKWQQFVNDSIVYALFNNSSQQSSLRKITYKDKLWDIKNEFFWMAKAEISGLSETHKIDEMYRDVKFSEERFVYNKLFGEERIYDKLSPIAKEVLGMANDLVIKSFPYRKLMAENNPEYHLSSWDAGYAQLKLVWKQYLPVEFKAFRDKYKELEDFMRPLVFELGFLFE